ncbi:MAG: TSUP family transporter, partial [Geminicoccaceae bacterium]
MSWLQPEGISVLATMMLVIGSAATSFLTAAAGIGGGVALLAIMAPLLPVATLIPLHGVIQIGSNTGRMLIMLRDVRLVVFLPFVIGSVVGSALGGAVVMQLPPAILQIALGVFILWSAWFKPSGPPASHLTIGLTGGVSSFLTMFFGATGMFVAAMLKTLNMDRLAHVATHAACMSAQHGVKVLTFGLLGFAYAPYLPFIILMIFSGFLGTLLGKRFLVRMT